MFFGLTFFFIDGFFKESVDHAEVLHSWTLRIR